jgi:hypothetical protein
MAMPRAAHSASRKSPQVLTSRWSPEHAFAADRFTRINTAAWMLPTAVPHLHPGTARRKAAGGDLMARAMMSAEPVTVGECGYPDLLATGESCKGGRQLHDRQHPHDLFMELAAGYERELTPGLGLHLYGGPVAEPALGPTAYPHRVSALPNPIAPIGHHWFDATPISFGVATAGLFGRRWKLEESIFNGRKPDENRYDIDLDRLDSYSGRLWVTPNDHWALQASAGRLVDA